MKKEIVLVLMLSAVFGGCGHSQSYKVGLMSLGDLEGKSLPDGADTTLREGQDCGHAQYLSNAVRDALRDTDSDTLIDSEVTSSTGLLVWSNCIKVKGHAINSKTIQTSGDTR